VELFHVLWPLIGIVNQLLAGLALLVATVYLAKKKNGYLLYTSPYDIYDYYDELGNDKKYR